MRKTRIVVALAVIAGLGLAPAPVEATAAPPALGLPCLPGVPLPGDYDGDSYPDQLVSVVGLGDSHSWSRYQVTPGNGGVPTWLYLGAGLTSADLNGDLCADALNGASMLLGGPDGLDPGSVTTLTLPQSAGLDPDDIKQVVVSDVVAFRHDGISQVVLAGYFDDDGPLGNPFLDVFTLDAAGVAGVPQVITLTEVSSTEAVVLAASRGTVAVGLPDLGVAGKTQAGGVSIFTVDTTDHTTLVRRTILTQDSPGVPGTAEIGDGFGWTIDLRDGRLAVGVPLEDTGKATDSGAVQPIRWHEATATYTAYRRIEQGITGVPGTDETGDWFGYQVLVTRGLTGHGSYDIAIGTRETVGAADDAGSVTVASFATPIYRRLTQNAPGIAGHAEKDDFFGSGIGVLRTSATTDTLLIGAPGERTTSVRQVGYAIRSDGRRLSSATRWTSLGAPAPTAEMTYENWGGNFGR